MVQEIGGLRTSVLNYVSLFPVIIRLRVTSKLVWGWLLSRKGKYTKNLPEEINCLKCLITPMGVPVNTQRTTLTRFKE